jgi:L-rhamnose mutarotase
MNVFTYNKFPHGTYEISASLLFQQNNINNALYIDIVNLITDYSVFLEEHIKYCNDYYKQYNNKIIIECMANSEHMDLLNNTTGSIMDMNMKNRLNNIEKVLDRQNYNNLKDILWRRYRTYKYEINRFLYL